MLASYFYRFYRPFQQCMFARFLKVSCKNAHMSVFALLMFFQQMHQEMKSYMSDRNMKTRTSAPRLSCKLGPYVPRAEDRSPHPRPSQWFLSIESIVAICLGPRHSCQARPVCPWKNSIPTRGILAIQEHMWGSPTALTAWDPSDYGSWMDLGQNNSMVPLGTPNVGL